METQDNKPIEVPTGDTKEDIKAREGIISDVGMKQILQKQFSIPI
jgi:hypothetical protein